MIGDQFIRVFLACLLFCFFLFFLLRAPTKTKATSPLSNTQLEFDFYCSYDQHLFNYLFEPHLSLTHLTQLWHMYACNHGLAILVKKKSPPTGSNFALAKDRKR
jgi:hypothetical protein